MNNFRITIIPTTTVTEKREKNRASKRNGKYGKEGFQTATITKQPQHIIT